MASEYDALLESQSVQPKSEYDALLEQPAQQPQATKGFGAFMRGLNVSGIPGDILGTLTPVTAAPRAIKQAIDVVRGVPVAQAIPESQELVGIEKKPLEERISAGLNVATQLAFLSAGARSLPLREIAFGKTEVGKTPSLRETAFGKQEAPLAAETAAESEVIKNASQKPSAERVPSAQVRPGVDEKAPLRQQGQAPEVRQEAQKGAVAPVPQPEQPSSEAGQTPAVSGQPKIIATAVQSGDTIVRGEGFEPHDSIAARVAAQRPSPPQETGIVPVITPTEAEPLRAAAHKWIDNEYPPNEFRAEPDHARIDRIVDSALETKTNLTQGGLKMSPDELKAEINSAISGHLVKNDITPFIEKPSSVPEGETRAIGIQENQKGFIIREPDGTERFTNDRTEAAGIAKAAGQVKPENAGTTELHSQQLEHQTTTDAISRIVNQANTQPRELRIAIDNKTGEVLAENEGKQLPKEWDKPTEEAGWGSKDEPWRKVGGAESITDMHSHPESIGPSDGDWGVFGFGNVKRMIVAEKGGKLWTLEKTSKWDEMPWQERTPRKLREAYNQFVDEIQGEELTSRSTEEHIAHVNRQMAEKFGVKLTESTKPVSTGGEAPAVATQPKEVPPVPPETPEALGEALKEKPRLAGPSNRVLQERAARGEIPQAPESGHGILKEDLIAQANQRYSPERAQLAGQKALQGKTTLADEADVVLHEEKLTKAAADAERALKANPTDPALQQVYQTARNAMTDWQHGPIAAIKTAWANKGINLQGATDVDTGTLVGLQKLAWDSGKGDFTPQQRPIMDEAANRVTKAIAEEKTSILKANTEVQKVLKPSRYMDFNQLRESLAQTLKSITC